jgi:hypothetical protein
MHRRAVTTLFYAAVLCSVLVVALDAVVSSGLEARAYGQSKKIYFDVKPRLRRTLNDASSTELATRADGTVSTFLYKRFIWAWLGAELLWKGLGAATAIWGAGCTIAGATKSMRVTPLMPTS